MKRKRGFKSVLAVALTLALTLSLAGCGSSDNGTASGSGTQASPSVGTVYTIGFNTWGSGTSTFDNMGDDIAYALEVLGMEGSRVADDFTADKELQNMQNFISAGVDGIVMQISADPVLTQAADACLNAKIPFVLGIFVGDDEDRAEVSANNEYYVGSVSANLYQDGYLMGQAAAADGHKTAVLLGGNVGDNHFEQRIAGFTQAFVTEGGGKILDEARCASPAEGQEKANAMLSANRDADCIYAMVGDYAPGAINAMDALGLEMDVYVSNAGEDAVNYIKEGRVAAGGGGNDLPGPIAAALLINYLDGTPILDADGNAPEFKITPFVVTKDNVDDYISIFYEDTHPINQDIMESLVSRYTEGVSYETFEKLIESGLTLEALLAAHGS